jgi:hypothetical protein
MLSLQDFIDITAPKTENITEYNNIRINSRGLISFDGKYNIIDYDNNVLHTIEFRITINKQRKLNVMMKGVKDYKAYYRYKQYRVKDNLVQLFQGWLYEYQDDLAQFFKKRK